MQNIIHWIQTHSKPFRLGFFGAFGVCSPLLFASPPFLDPMIWSFAVKLVLSGACAFVAGLCTSLATDFYKEFKNRIKKHKDAKRAKEIERGKKQERA